MEPSGLVSTVKEGLALKLETPYMVAASTLGLLSVPCMLPGDVPFDRPLEALSKFFAWTGWASPVGWLDTAHQWMSDPSRIEATHGLFVMLALFGTLFASYSRASFAALVGISGLVETGSVTQAWVLPVSILIAMTLAGWVMRLWNDDLWERAWLSWFWMMMALGYCVLMLIAFVFGERKGRTRPQPVEVELSWEAQRYIDKRLKAFGMPSLIPPVSVPTIAPSVVTSRQLAQEYREKKIRDRENREKDIEGDAA
ncbi:O-antigen ligase family protein [Mycobacteroides abscessus]|uniref:O-antigen ligase family protein n=1 Tax=Mycobacteroides abscessus TaxID=36809 RepID=UPI000C2656A8|nr:O-antigen ligase family protein [Mycobacteroides abscessus]